MHSTFSLNNNCEEDPSVEMVRLRTLVEESSSESPEVSAETSDEAEELEDEDEDDEDRDSEEQDSEDDGSEDEDCEEEDVEDP